MTERERRLSRAFVELADTLVDDFDLTDFLHSLSSHCVDLFEVDAAGLMLADQAGGLRVVGSSSEESRMLELFEVQNGDGPCLDCYRAGDHVSEDDLQSARRWPLFGPEALNAGYRSVFAVPLRLRTDVIGALNLFSSQPAALDDTALGLCRALADVATIGLLQQRTMEASRVLAGQLQTALDSRVVIEQAKGVLAERAGKDLGEAFEILRRHARSHQLHVAKVARGFLSGDISLADFDISDR